MSVDLLYLTANRRAFTALTFELLVENTNWDRVDHLIVYDDSSTDGARDEVVSRLARVPVPHEIRDHEFGSPVAVMNDYIAQTASSLFAKIDNDVALPPLWLDHFLGVMEAKNPPELLGTESPFMGPPPEGWDGTYTWHPWKHIGGVGVMQTEFFKRTGPMPAKQHHGFTQHQWKYRPRRGWINPDIAACLLDRCPVEPWLSISRDYEGRGWQRPWKKIPMQFDFYYSWLPTDRV